MIELTPLLWAMLAGIGIGIFFFGGLGLTVRQIRQTKQPVLLFMSSFLIRLVVSMAAFYLVMGGDWRRAIACGLGFFMTRVIIVYYWEIEPA